MNMLKNVSVKQKKPFKNFKRTIWNKTKTITNFVENKIGNEIVSRPGIVKFEEKFHKKI